MTTCDCCGKRPTVRSTAMWGPRCAACPDHCESDHGTETISARVTGFQIIDAYGEWHFLPDDSPLDGPVGGDLA